MHWIWDDERGYVAHYEDYVCCVYPLKGVGWQASLSQGNVKLTWPKYEDNSDTSQRPEQCMGWIRRMIVLAANEGNAA